ncbi:MULTISPECIES: methylaspartate ammonia-lyase [Pelosinus]|uniref:methylaspartate ammonia-lyase n=1 Tax=Pelosinus fermentans B4 TaxID=1149862 RepID=I9B6S7_9FIRM|nr:MULTISPECIES: methylaspartate ammonia-lyase [Pelosinus]EIW20817.1 methylaspartate ammonia-lyase [Pelosinus fermentans B4]EIW25338.1 methylaspartate ammonia-lyase [Pelosinus fermentans A11]OAM93596.1 methylaspartate ammonia-lyase [Pelosinus fermentans DSM 17108]SDQ83336.1 methylaspartate ammonia-lyase [Pelosinus fermentans]
MKIVNVVCSKGRTGFYFDDQRAIKAGAQHDGFSYVGETVTPGFHSIRQTGEAVSVMIVLEDGQVAYGDCAAVQYSGAGGRDPLFLAEDFIPVIEQEIKPRLVGRELTSFRQLAGEIDSMVDAKTGKLIHTALRYGVTQAILDAVSKAKHKLMCEVVAEEYNTTVSETAIDIFTQSGDNRYDNADKMIIKGAQVLPHALINNVEEKLGKNGELLLEYVTWLKNRILSLRTSNSYNPVLHIDVYGTIGAAFDLDTERMVSYFRELEKAAAPLKLRIEGPMDVEDREKQMLALKEITARLHEEKINVEVVADEWCNTLEDIKYFADNNAGDMLQIKTPDLGGINNTIEAVLYCKEKGVGAYQGGTCNETDRSAQVCVHLAMATKPVQMLAKPGMGVDEGIMIVYNEMQRILAVRQARKA